MKFASITNLQYTVDIIIFGNIDIKKTIIWKWIIHTIQIWSRLTINYEKSQIIFMGEVNMEGWIVEQILEYPRGTFPIKYLGVPLTEKR